MAKLKAPLLSFFARGGIGRLLDFRARGNQSVVTRYPIPTDRKTPAQIAHRTLFKMAIDMWHALSATEQAEWERIARPLHMTGYAFYLSTCLRPNPGTYLPLAGGTMQGEIDMATHAITNLPPLNLPNQPRFHAIKNASEQAFTTGETKVTFETENYDTQGEFDPVTNFRYTAKQAEHILVMAFVSVTDPANGDVFYCSLKKNTSTYLATYWTSFYSAGAGYVSMAPFAIAPLAIDDYVEVFIKRHVGTGTKHVGSLTNAQFYGHMLS